MNRTNSWIVAGAILAATIIFSLSHAFAQRDFRTDPRPAHGPEHRYQVVNVTEGEIIIIDVTTGDLYSAKPSDVKPYDSRPRPNSSKVFFTDKKGYAPAKDKDKGPGPRFPGVQAVPPPVPLPPRIDNYKDKDKKG